MAKYAAFLRGIGPGDPNMRNDKLRGVFEGLGFGNVQSVTSSGNILFEDDGTTDVAELEQRIEGALRQELGVRSAAIIRSREELQNLLEKNLFADYEHGAKAYLTITFLKHRVEVQPQRIPSPATEACKVLGFDNQIRAICVCTDTTGVKAQETMRWLESVFGKDITTRTLATVGRISQKL